MGKRDCVKETGTVIVTEVEKTTPEPQTHKERCGELEEGSNSSKWESVKPEHGNEKERHRKIDMQERLRE